MASRADFYIEEYKALRAEILSKLEAISRTEALVGAGVAAMYAWLATRAFADRIAWAAPSVLVVLGAARAETLGRQVTILGQYVWELERALVTAADPKPTVEGWEHYRSSKHVKSRFFDAAARAFWVVAFLGTLAFPFVLRGTVYSSTPKADTVTVRMVRP